MSESEKKSGREASSDRTNSLLNSPPPELPQLPSHPSHPEALSQNDKNNEYELNRVKLLEPFRMINTF